MDKIKSTQDMIDLMNSDRSEIENYSIDFRLKQKKLSKTIESKKAVILEAMKLNFYPLYLKSMIFYKLRVKKNELVEEFTEKYCTSDLMALGFYSKYRLIHIAEIFKKKDINKVYEFGSGISTIFFSFLLKKKEEDTGRKGCVVSFEQSETIYKDLLEGFPNDLKRYIDLSHRSLRIHKKGQVRLLSFNIDSYDQDIDLVYIDGPTHQLFDPKPKSDKVFHVNGNLIEMAEKGMFKMAFTDHRWNLFPVFQSFFKKNDEISYDLRIDNINKSILIERID